MKALIFWLGTSALILAFSSLCGAPKVDTTPERVKTKITVPYQKIGTLLQKDVSRVKNNLTVGCETLDRDYADYDAYKEYLPKLGVKKIRLQGGWAKSEKVKGVYDFKWLDHIIDDACSRGHIVWLQTSYGNPIYKGGGTPFLKGGMPTSREGIAAWNKWVDAMAKRYAGKVEWEMWNEPDIGINTKLEAVENNIRTAEIIRKYDPNAKIAALALAKLGAEHLEEYLKIFKEKGKFDMFSWISYHGYDYRPENSYKDVEVMREILKKYSKKVILRQGENGAPSKGFLGGALTKHNWTELTQAKWDLRRMLGDWGRGIDTSVFSISDMRYAATDAIKITNVKGLLQTDENNQVVKIKMAFYAVQNLVSIFDILENRKGAFIANDSYCNDILCAFAYEDNDTRLPSFVMWFGDTIPSNLNGTMRVDVKLKGGAIIREPVWVDILTGGVYEIPQSDISRVGDTLRVNNLPLYDSPIVVVDKSLVDFIER